VAGLSSAFTSMSSLMDLHGGNFVDLSRPNAFVLDFCVSKSRPV
jgi:hypothetical protein